MLRIVWAAFAALDVSSAHGSHPYSHLGWAVFFGLLAVRPYPPKEDS